MTRDPDKWWFSAQERVNESSRWHHSHEGRLETPDRIGDRLVQWLWESDIPMGKVYDPFVYTISKHLLQYEEETRPLFRLVRTGYILRVIEGCYRDASAELRGRAGVDGERGDWTSVLDKERSERCKILSWQLLKFGEDLGNKLGEEFGIQLTELRKNSGEDPMLRELAAEGMHWNEEDALELLTLLKNDYKLYSQTVYTEEEERLAELAFDLIATAANFTVISIPRLFVDPIETSDIENPEKHKGCRRWFGVHVEVVKTFSSDEIDFAEEKAIRQMALMENLYHPLLRKLYGAWHIGLEPSFLWERVSLNKSRSTRTDIMPQCLEGFQYLQMRGLCYDDQLGPKDKIRFSRWTKKMILDCQNLVKISDFRTPDADELNHKADELLRQHAEHIRQLQKEIKGQLPKFVDKGAIHSTLVSSDLNNSDEDARGGSSSKEPWRIDLKALFDDQKTLFNDSKIHSESADFMSWGGEIMNGGFATVCYAWWYNSLVAVKMLKPREGKTPEELKKDFHRETDLWYKLSHPNIVKLFGANTTDDNKVEKHFFVCEPGAEQKTLDKIIDIDRHVATKELALWALYQAALGLQYLHSRGVVHGDLKGNNILVFTSPELIRSGSDLEVCDGVTVKLTDFGLSHYSWEKPAMATGAIRWVAPEILKASKEEQQPTFESDIFALGMCILEALSGDVPWPSIDSNAAVKFHAKRGQLPKKPTTKSTQNDELVTEEDYNLVVQMCQPNPTNRISIFAVVNELYKLAECQTKKVKNLNKASKRRDKSWK